MSKNWRFLWRKKAAHIMVGRGANRRVGIFFERVK
jgi:hypothetical protein